MKTINPIQDSIKTLDLISNGMNNELYLRGYHPIYLFTNENVTGIMNNIDLSNKRILLPQASGDQVFDFLLESNANITTFDINILSYYFFELKKAAIISLTRDEFIDFFCITKIDFKNNFFNLKTYNKIRVNLPIEIRKYWDIIFKSYSGRKIKNSSFCRNNYYSKEVIISINPYLKEENYNKLKKLLKDFEPEFINCDIRNLYLYLNSEYDFIYFSNILSTCYKQTHNQIELVNKILNSINSNISKNGVVGLLYLYNYLAEENIESKEDLYNYNFRNNFLSNPNNSIINFSDPFSECNNKFGDYIDKDALILTKKRI